MATNGPSSRTEGTEPTRSVLFWVVESSTRAAELLTVAMMALIAVEVICRGFFNFSLLLVDEIAGYMLVAIMFLGVTVSFRSGSLLRVEFVLDRLPLRARLFVEGVFDLVGFGFAAILDYAMINYVLSTFQRDMRAPTLLATPLYFPQAVMPLGVTLLAVALLASAIEKLRRARSMHTCPDDAA